MQNNDTLASIIILSYNNTKYLKENLDSVLRQDYTPIEIIIRDDCSENFGTNDIDEIKDYIEKNKTENIRGYKVEKNDINEGTVKNLNKCIKSSKGKYLLTLSADDCFYDKSVVSKIIEYFRSSEYMIATSNSYKCDNNLNLIKPSVVQNWQKKLLMKSPKELYIQLSKANFISGSNLYYTRDFIAKYGLYDEEYVLLEDYPKLLNITRQGCKIGFIEDITIKRRGGGVSSNLSNYDLDKENKHRVSKQLKIDLENMKSKEILPYLDIIKDEISRK